MSVRSKKILLLLLIIIIVSTGFIIARFGAATAGNGSNDQITQAFKSQSDGESDEKPIMTPDSGSMVIPFLKLIGALLLVVAGIYGFIYVLRRMMGGKFSANRKDSLIEILESSYIAQKKSISLVRFADRAVLVGVSDAGINVLAELNPDETSKILNGQSLERPVAGFRNALKDARKSLTSLNLKRVKELRLTKDTESPQTA
jgi:flagellar biosynthetic protein FliO